MIEAHQLTKRYGPKTAVDGLDFTARPGVVTPWAGFAVSCARATAELIAAGFVRRRGDA